MPRHAARRSVAGMLRTALASILAAAAVAATAAAAGATELPTLPNDDADAKPVRAGTTYSAGSFPLALRITPPDGSWLAGQETIVTAKRGSFGSVEFMHAPAAAPLGAISMIASVDGTPSVATAVAQLRSAKGATFGPTTPTRLAGFSGSRLDATVGAKRAIFVPLSPPSHAARYHPDAYVFDAGEVLRFVVLDVRGKTVVLLIENAGLPADRFGTFLDSAGGLLSTLRFPA
jgi:hypothetical protein